MELVKFNSETGLNEVNWEDLVDYPEFRALYALNYNKEAGDIDGRKRFRATREIKYLKSFYDPMSSENRKGLQEEEKRKRILAAYNLPIDFQESEELQAAKDVYLKNFEFIHYKLLSVTKRTIMSFISKLDVLQNTIDTFKEGESNENSLKNVIDSGKYILSLVKELPDALLTLRSIEEKIANDQLGGSTSVFADATPSRFEDTRVKVKK